jgi:site-specific DNA-methyltransferase (adenine-specific)
MTSITFNEDCMAVMARYPNKFFDLAVVDPPYGIERFKKGGSHINKYGDENKHWNNEKPKDTYFSELFRVSKNQIIWGGNNFNLPTSEYFVIWKKSNAEDFSFAMCEYAWTNCKVPAKIYTKLHVQTQETRIHPTQKPVALYDWIYHNYAKPGDLILDTHLGSGSSRIAAHKAGLSFVGCELDKEYFDAQEKRFKEFTAQLRLF